MAGLQLRERAEATELPRGKWRYFKTTSQERRQQRGPQAARAASPSPGIRGWSMTVTVSRTHVKVPSGAKAYALMLPNWSFHSFLFFARDSQRHGHGKFLRLTAEN